LKLQPGNLPALPNKVKIKNSPIFITRPYPGEELKPPSGWRLAGVGKLTA
jgi:hypothetical protein